MMYTSLNDNLVKTVSINDGSDKQASVKAELKVHLIISKSQIGLELPELHRTVGVILLII